MQRHCETPRKQRTIEDRASTGVGHSLAQEYQCSCSPRVSFLFLLVTFRLKEIFGCHGKAILHSTISTDFLGHILQGQNHGAAFSEAGVGNLRDLMPDDLSETDLIIIEKVHNKCNKLESSPNHLPTSSLWKNCLPRNWILVPKKVGDRCSKQLRSSSNARLIEQAHRNRKELETTALKYQFPTRLMLEEVTERTWLPADLRAEWALEASHPSLVPGMYILPTIPQGVICKDCSLETVSG